MGMQRSGADELAGSTANGESTGRETPVTDAGALDGERLSAQGQKMAALGNDPRLAAMLVSAKNDDEAATAAKLPPFSKSRHGWAIVTGRGVFAQSTRQQRSQQLLKRLNVRGGEADSSLIAPRLAGAYADRIARRRGQEGRYQLANGMGRCSMPTMRLAATNG